MLYIHIPFCQTRCTYCNFFSSTMLGEMWNYCDALCRQLVELRERSVFSDTVYIGGGTPSVLPSDCLDRLLRACSALLNEGGEFTVECNPDDVTDSLAATLRGCGVNRVSLGVQTFDDARLRLLRRRHTAEKAREAVALLRAHDIINVSIDLMYGFPDETIGQWDHDIIEVLSLRPAHISAYCLTVEEGTALNRQLSKGLLPPLPAEDEQRGMYYLLRNRLIDAGYSHYEISNFCLPDCHSRHNSGYWQDKPYTALGAGAYGYDKENGIRYSNIADIREYIRRVNSGVSVVDFREDIDDATHYNDLITTAMRTCNGLSSEYIRNNCSAQLSDYFVSVAEKLCARGLVSVSGEGAGKRVCLKPDSLFVSDSILSEFVWV
ncbi:MAG: radical SAM family heme chaperone HemW [Bacteroidaceae bacterium]|nr:radical SAM family heme chaperone HemW [Bacteroidaceae bacterium]